MLEWPIPLLALCITCFCLGFVVGAAMWWFCYRKGPLEFDRNLDRVRMSRHPDLPRGRDK